MPESKGRKEAEAKAVAKRKTGSSSASRREKSRASALNDNRAWVPPTFITLGLLGVLWLVVYYIASPYIPFMAMLGPWNMLIGMGLMAAAFVVATPLEVGRPLCVSPGA